MKKLLPIFLFAFISLTINAQDTLVGFNFGINKHANFGTDTNKLDSIYVMNDGGAPASVYMTQGVASFPDSAATAMNWDAGSDAKYWMIKVYTKGFENLTLSSKQRAGNNPKGPKNFKAQYRIGILGTWTDITGATAITLANDWSGALANVSLPTECANIDSMVYVRWIMTSNLATDNSTVQSGATSKIDDIFVKGSAITTTTTNKSIENDIYSFENTLYLKVNEKQVSFTIFDINGRILNKGLTDSKQIDISILNNGIYFINIVGTQNYFYKFVK
ncbi:MAG: T9SS type A sorting domain-containing protein [Bacteroidota bacterium]